MILIPFIPSLSQDSTCWRPITPGYANTPVILQTGCRLFFLSAEFYALVSMIQWTYQLYAHTDVALQYISRASWHAHEMMFGYNVIGLVLVMAQRAIRHNDRNNRQQGASH